MENGDHASGLLVSRRDWSEAAPDGRDGGSEREADVASSAPGAAALRESGLLSEGAGSPEGGSPLHAGGTRSHEFVLPRDD